LNMTYKRFIPWLFVILWMGIIFFLSAQTAAESSGLSGQTIRALIPIFMPEFIDMSQVQQNEIVANLQHLVRNIAHILIYSVLGVLCICALISYKFKLKVKIFATLVICTVYAATDELHQLFVDGRGFQFSDIFLDFCGAFLGVLVVVGVYWMRGRKGKVSQVSAVVLDGADVKGKGDGGGVI
jgi:VanZ family protein